MMNMSDIPQWITELTDEDLLAVYDVALDIREEHRGEEYETVIPVYRLVARFAPLCPSFSPAFVDRYCELRWKATLLLKRSGVIVDFDVIKGHYRWESNLRIHLNPQIFAENFLSLEKAYQARFKDNLNIDGPFTQGVTGSPPDLLRSIMLRFHDVAVQLRERHDRRPTLDVADEHDVRDLLRALLCLHFDGIRPVEWTPAYLCQTPHVDFLLEHEKIAVTVKKTGAGLGPKELMEQLIVDRDWYSKMKGCDTLVCLVYDTENRVGNAVGLEPEQIESRGDCRVEVLVVPKNY